MSEKLSIEEPSIETIRSLGLEARGRGRAVGLDSVDAGFGDGTAQKIEGAGENRDRQQEIGDRPGRDDRRSFDDRLAEEADLALGRPHFFKLVAVRRARGVFIAVELHIAAERNGGDAPAGAMLVEAVPQLGAESHREGQNPHAAPPRDQEMAELVNEDHDGQNRDVRQRVCEGGKPEPVDLVEHQIRVP